MLGGGKNVDPVIADWIAESRHRRELEPTCEACSNAIGDLGHFSRSKARKSVASQAKGIPIIGPGHATLFSSCRHVCGTVGR